MKCDENGLRRKYVNFIHFWAEKFLFSLILLFLARLLQFVYILLLCVFTSEFIKCSNTLWHETCTQFAYRMDPWEAPRNMMAITQNGLENKRKKFGTPTREKMLR